MPRTETTEFPPKTLLHTISFAEVDGYAVTEQKTILHALERWGLLSEQFLYSAFRADRIPRVLRTGTYRSPREPDYNVIFGCHLSDDGAGNLSIETYSKEGLVYYITTRAEGQKYGAFAVYSVDAFEEIATDEYKFKDPGRRVNALVAVVKIVDFWPTD